MKSQVKKMFTAVVAMAAIFMLQSCGSDDPVPVVKPADVYLTGNTLSNGMYLPVLWKNGVETILSQTPGQGYGVAVKGEDVYVIGYLDDNTDKKVMWINGVKTDFSDGSSYVYIEGMRLIGNDLVVIGSIANKSTGERLATYWKNGVAHSFQTDGDSYASDIAIDGNDVYVVGAEMNTNGNWVAKLWKNDLPTSLTDGAHQASAYGITINSGKKYITYHDNYTLKLWNDGAVTTLGKEGESGGGVHNVSVINNEVLVVGYEGTSGNYKAMYWKNGVKNQLPVNASFDTSVGYSIEVIENDVYFLGNATKGSLQPSVVWKNFESLAPFDGTFANYATAMCVAK